jgi:hypothetical protein
MRRIEIGWKTPKQTIGNIFLLAQDDRNYICVSDIGKILVYSKEDFTIRFLDPLEEEKQIFGNTELVKQLQVDIYNDRCNFEKSIIELTERVEKLEADNEKFPEIVNRLEMVVGMFGITPTMQGESERVVGNTDIPPRTWTREEIGEALFNYLIGCINEEEYKKYKSVYDEGTQEDVCCFFFELDKIKSNDLTCKEIVEKHSNLTR